MGFDVEVVDPKISFTKEEIAHSNIIGKNEKVFVCKKAKI